ncbi:MAG: hypothetical protein R3E31_07145 [Chloroflexota bacterium]
MVFHCLPFLFIWYVVFRLLFFYDSPIDSPVKRQLIDTHKSEHGIMRRKQSFLFLAVLMALLLLPPVVVLAQQGKIVEPDSAETLLEQARARAGTGNSRFPLPLLHFSHEQS